MGASLGRLPDQRVAPPPRSPSSSLAGQLPAHERGARGEPRELLVTHVAGRPAEAAVGVHRELLSGADPEDLADAPRHVLGGVLGEPLDVDDARAELAPLAVALPEVELGHLAARELEDELVGAGLQDAGKVGLVGPLEARATEAVAEADMEAELHADSLGRQVEETRHLLAGDV